MKAIFVFAAVGFVALAVWVNSGLVVDAFFTTIFLVCAAACLAIGADA